MRYWVRINKQSLGPFTPEEIRRHPEIGEATLVLPEGRTRPEDWVRLRQVPELAALFAPDVPPPRRQVVPTPPPEMDDSSRPAPRPPPLPGRPVLSSTPSLSPTEEVAAEQRPTPVQGPGATTASDQTSTTGALALVQALLYLALACILFWISGAYSIFYSPPIPEIVYGDQAAAFFEASNFRWNSHNGLTLNLRFKRPLGHSVTIGYELRDAGGTVLGGGTLGRWTAGTPGPSYEEEIYVGRDKARRTKKIILKIGS